MARARWFMTWGRYREEISMRSLVVASILVAMTSASAFAQTKTTDPDSTMTESQKGGPASRESKPNAGGQETVTKGAGPTGSMTPKAGNAGGAGGMAAPKK
jgi:hypothetical protein